MRIPRCRWAQTSSGSMRPRGNQRRRRFNIIIPVKRSAARLAYEGPVALRPRLATGLPFRCRRPIGAYQAELEPPRSILEVSEVHDLFGDVPEFDVAVLGDFAQRLEGGFG